MVKRILLAVSILWMAVVAQARVVVLDTAEHAGPFVKATGAQVTNKLPGGLKAGDVVVITHESKLSLDEEKRLEELVRSGGGLLAAHTSSSNAQWMWENWASSPIERALPAVIVPKGIGIENYFTQTRVTEAAKHPVTAGVEIGVGPQVPFHVPVILPTDSRLSRHNLWPVWQDIILKPMISREWTPILRGDDAERRCLLAVGRYGAGYSAVMGVDYAGGDLSKWGSYAVLMKNLMTWLGQGKAATASTGARVLALRVDTPAVFALRRMGYEVLTTPPADWKNLDAVVQGDKLDDKEAGAVAAYLRGGGRVVALGPQALQAASLRTVTGAAAGTEPLLSEVWHIPDLRPGSQAATRRVPRSVFTGSGEPLWEGAPLEHHAFWFGEWDLNHTTIGWVEIPTGGAKNWALAVSPDRRLLETMRLDGNEVKLVDPPAGFAQTHKEWRWLPLDNLPAGRHSINFRDVVPMAGGDLLLVNTGTLRSTEAAVGKVEGWQYRAAKAGEKMPDQTGWTPQPPQPQGMAGLLPKVVPLGDEPKVKLPAQWKARQVGDMVSERDLREKWFAPEFDDTGWEPRALGPLRRTVGGKEVRWDQENGPVWYRASLQVPAAATQSGDLLALAASSNFLEVWVNGQKIGAEPGVVTVPLSRFKAGDNVIAVRVWTRRSGVAVPWALEGLTEARVLRGMVRYRADRNNIGEAKKWFKQAPQNTDEPQSLELTGVPRLEEVTWYWLTLDAPANRADVRLRFGEPLFLKVWLNGEPINTQEKQTSITIPHGKFKAGRNVLTIRRYMEAWWWVWGSLDLKIEAAPEPMPLWARAKARAPAAARAVRVSGLNAPALLFVDGGAALTLSENTMPLPEIKPGEHTFTLLLPEGGTPPSLEWISAAPGRVLLARWQEHAKTATLPAAGSAGWQPIRLEKGAKGVLQRFTRRETKWFTTNFNVSAAQANQAALLHFTTPEATSVEPGLVKELWINGKHIKPTERKWAQDFYPFALLHKTTTFDLTGNLQAGENTISLRPDFSRYKGLDLAVPSDAPWLIPLPELELNPTWQRLDLGGTPLSRVAPPDFYKRETFVPDLLPGAQTLGKWGDGAPAFLRKKIGAGEIIAATANFSLFLRPRILWAHWGGEANDMEGGALAANGTYSVVRQDDTQLLAGLLDAFQPRSGPRITKIEAVPGQEQVRITVESSGTAFSGQLAVRVMSWENALLKSDAVPVAVPAKGNKTITVKFAGAPHYFGARLKDEYSTRAAVLSADGSAVLDYLDRVLDATPPVTVNLATDDPIERNLPDTVPGAPQYRKTWATWKPTKEATPTFVYYPGETAHLHTAITNQTAQPRTVKVEVSLSAQLSGKSTLLSKQTFTLAPHEQKWMTFEQKLTGDFEPYVLQAKWSETGGAEYSTQKPFTLVKPFKTVLDPENYVNRGGLSLHGPGAAAQNTGSFEFPAFDPQTVYGPTSFELEWFELDNLIEAPGSGGGFGTPEIKNNFYWGPFDKGPETGASALDNSSYLPSGQRFWEWMGPLHREAMRARMGDVPTAGMLADFWIQYGMAEAPRNILQFAQWAKIMKAYQPQAKTIGGLQKELKEKFPVEWQHFFSVDASTRNIEQMGLAQSPGSSMWSQLDWLLPATGMREGHEWARVAGRWINSGEPDSLLARVHGGERFRSWMTGTARAFAPDFAVTSYHSTSPAANNAFFSWQHAQAGVGILPVEAYSRFLHGSSWLQTVGADGKLQPVSNLPMWKNSVPLSLFGGVSGYSTGTLTEWLLYERAFSLMNVVGMEKPLGAGFVVSTERIGEGSKIEGLHNASGGWGGLDNPVLVDNSLRNQWETLRNYGASVPVFIAPQQISNAPVPALVYTLPNNVPEGELAVLRRAAEGGKGLIAFFTTGGDQKQETTLSEYFGVKFGSGQTTSLEYSIAASKRAKEVLSSTLAGREGKVITRGAPLDPKLDVVMQLLSRYTEPQFVNTRNAEDDLIKLPGNSVGLKVVDRGKQRAAFSSFNGQDNWGSNHDLARAFAQAVNWAAGDPIRFPDGLAGHGWQAQGKTFLVVEELRGSGGIRELRVKLPAGNYRAVNLIDNQAVATTYDASSGYLTLKPSLRPLEALLIAIR